MRNSDIYLINVLSSSYGIIIHRAINAPGHGKNIFDGLNATGGGIEGENGTYWYIII